jgi:hypothetical protein
VRGLQPSTSYTLYVTALWTTFGPSLPSPQVVKPTGPPVASAGQPVGLWGDALAVIWCASACGTHSPGFRLLFVRLSVVPVRET